MTASINRIAGFIETAFGWAGIKVPRVSWGQNNTPANKVAGAGRTAAAFKRTAAGGGAAKTSVVGDVGSALSHTASAAAGALGGAANWAFDVAGAAWPKMPTLPGPLAGASRWSAEGRQERAGKAIGGVFGGKNPGSILAFAKQFLGVPYLWGGISGRLRLLGASCSYLSTSTSASTCRARRRSSSAWAAPWRRLLPRRPAVLRQPGAPRGHVRRQQPDDRRAPHGATVRFENFNWPDFSGARRAIYDRGGFLPPGLSLALNTTGLPERVLPPGRSPRAGDINVQRGAVQVVIGDTGNLSAGQATPGRRARRRARPGRPGTRGSSFMKTETSFVDDTLSLWHEGRDMRDLKRFTLAIYCRLAVRECAGRLARTYTREKAGLEPAAKDFFTHRSTRRGRSPCSSAG